MHLRRSRPDRLLAERRHAQEHVPALQPDPHQQPEPLPEQRRPHRRAADLPRRRHRGQCRDPRQPLLVVRRAVHLPRRRQLHQHHRREQHGRGNRRVRELRARHGGQLPLRQQRLHRRRLPIQHDRGRRLAPHERTGARKRVPDSADLSERRLLVQCLPNLGRVDVRHERQTLHAPVGIGVTVFGRQQCRLAHQLIRHVRPKRRQRTDLPVARP